MIAFLRLAVFGFLAMCVAYLALRVYFRSTRREELEKEWDADHPEGGEDGARDTYIEAGMREYHNSLRLKLVGLVFVIPTLAILLLIYLTNYF